MGSLWAGIWPNPAGWSAVLREWTLPWSVQEEWLGTAKLWPHWRRWGLLWPFHRYRCTALPVGCGRSYPHMTCLAQQVTPWFRILHSFHVWLPQGLLDVGQSKGMNQRQTWWCSRGFAQVVWEGWILLWGLVCLEAMDICILSTHRHRCLLWAVQRLSSGAQAVSLLPCWVLPFPSPIPCRGHCPAGWWPQPQRRQGGSLLQWRLGHSVWWWLDRPQCPGGLQAAGLQVGLGVCSVCAF